ncbi:hypothetical protein BGZ63DRAFT_415502 [Mariannaea sp. PMI_226]|nr:hypothetical protein BGZ63DRAFT_415502 [Mariannaea sp. PMI_226]
MATHKDGIVISKKRTHDSTCVYEATSNGSTHKRRNSQKKSLNRDVEASLEGVSCEGVIPRDSIETNSLSPAIDSDGLSSPATGTRERREENEEQTAMRLEKMRGAVRTLLECIGEDADREGLLDTPSRYSKALLFLTKGYQVNMKDIVNNALFNVGNNDMVIVKGIEIFSLCEHHLVPFIGKMHIGYIPSDTVIGLSKLPRIAEIFSRRLQIQERLTKEVADAVMEVLKPQGVAVVMEASHLCMVMRGVEKTSATTLTSCMLGCFEHKRETRNEFLHFVGVSR